MLTDYFAPQEGRVAVVIAHFNPCFYAQREYNLRHCLRMYQAFGIPTYVGAILPPGQQWDLDAPEYQDRVRVFRNRDFLWNRERLINLTVESLVSPEYSHVGWSNADIIQTSSELMEFSFGIRDTPAQRRFIQPFGTVSKLDRLGKVTSMIRAATDLPAGEKFTSAHLYGRDTGTAWLAPRDFFPKCGLYRYGLDGAADQLMLACLTDQMDDRLFNSHVGTEYAPHWRDYTAALKVYRDSLASQTIGCLGGQAIRGWSGCTHAGMIGRTSVIQSIKLSHLRIEDGLIRWAADAPDQVKDQQKQIFHARKEDTP